MKGKLAKITSVLFLCLLIFGTNVFAVGFSGRATFTVPQNQAWVARAVNRTGLNYDVYARLYAVYPVGGGYDNFEKAQVRVTAADGTIMSDIHILDETDTRDKTILLRNGTLGHRNIRFQFRGNDPRYAARVDVFYDGR